MNRYEGKVAAVAGGASRIGEAAGRRFVEDDARVAFGGEIRFAVDSSSHVSNPPATSSEHPARCRTPAADRGCGLPCPVPLAPGYLRRIARLEALAGNASGADKSWVHRAHADAVRHLGTAKRR